jgi:hypothetical protein
MARRRKRLGAPNRDSYKAISNLAEAMASDAIEHLKDGQCMRGLDYIMSASHQMGMATQERWHLPKAPEAPGAHEARRKIREATRLFSRKCMRK